MTTATFTRSLYDERLIGPCSADPASTSTYIGIFFVALATLMYEILLTRIFSVTMLYHFAFVALSVAMFGMTAGALIVYLAPQLLSAGAAAPIGWRSRRVAFPIAIVLSFLTELSIPFRVHPSVVAIYAIALHLRRDRRAVRRQRHRDLPGADRVSRRA